MKKPKPIKMWAIVYEGDILLDYMAGTKKQVIHDFINYFFYYQLTKKDEFELFKSGKAKAIKVEVRAI